MLAGVGSSSHKESTVVGCIWSHCREIVGQDNKEAQLISNRNCLSRQKNMDRRKK